MPASERGVPPAVPSHRRRSPRHLSASPVPDPVSFAIAPPFNRLPPHYSFWNRLEPKVPPPLPLSRPGSAHPINHQASSITFDLFAAPTFVPAIAAPNLNAFMLDKPERRDEAGLAKRLPGFGVCMKTTELTAEQRQALIDLLILGMYADRKLASAEDACLQSLLASFHFTSDFERDSFADAAFTRTTRHIGSPDAVRAYVNDLARRFQATELRQNVYERLNQLLTSDGRITTEESQLLAAIKEAFQL